MRFDPTPDGVTLFRVNAIGFSVSILAMITAGFWWASKAIGPDASGAVFQGIAAATALSVSVFYLLPAVVPRRMWGYVVAWTQLMLAVTSGTGTLPTIAVLIAFSKSEVLTWFQRKPIGPRPADRASTRAALIAIVGYYTLVSVLPLGFAAAYEPPKRGADVAVEAIQTAPAHIEFTRRGVEKTPLNGRENFTATKLTTGEHWELSDQTGPVAVTVWATYCGSCSRQLRSIGDSPTGLGAGTRHVTVALDCDQKPAKVRQQLGHSGIRSEALCLKDGLDVNVLPTTVFFDSAGRRRATVEGNRSAQALAAIAAAVESAP